MAITYKRYLKLNIDGSRVGLEHGESENNYFCTPKGAKVIGWGGVDGIHYCFVRGFGEMVFAVSPMNTPGNYVHPVARDFKDFFGLLLACGHMAVLEQVWCWNQGQFDGFLRENHPSTGKKYTLTVQKYEYQEFSAKHFNDPNQELPKHYTMMSYTISPHLPAGSFTVTDCVPSDRPQQKHTDPNAPQVTNDVCCIGIIGGADGQTAIVFGGGNEGKLRVACSALHFEPVDEVEWRMVFHEKRCEDILLTLI